VSYRRGGETHLGNEKLVWFLRGWRRAGVLVDMDAGLATSASGIPAGVSVGVIDNDRRLLAKSPT